MDGKGTELAVVDSDEPTEEQTKPFRDLDDTSTAEIKEIFSLFDFKQNGSIATRDMGTVLRGIGWNLTEEQIGDFINEYDHDGTGAIDFPVFFSIVQNNWPMRGPCTEKRARADFGVFDIYNDGYITGADLVNVLQERSEPLTQTDVDNLLIEIIPIIDGDNRIKISDFVSHMFRSVA